MSHLRWADEGSAALLAAILEALWLAALLAAAGWLHFAAAFATVALITTAGAIMGTASKSEAFSVGRARAVQLATAAAGGTALWLEAGGQAAAGDLVNLSLWVLLAGGAVWLGVRAGRERIEPYSAVRRSSRVFATLVGILMVAAAGGSAGRWPGLAGVVLLLVSALAISVSRVRFLRSQVGEGYVRRSRRWVGVSLAALVLAVLIAAAAAELLPPELVREGLRYTLVPVRLGVFALAYVVGMIGYGAARVIGEILGLFHVSLPAPGAPPSRPSVPRFAPAPRRHSWWDWSGFALAARVAAVTLSVALIGWVLYRVARRSRPLSDEVAGEERSTTFDTREALAVWTRRASRLGASVAMRLALNRDPRARIRWRYARLEHALSRAGHGRPAATSVRTYLDGLGCADATVGSDVGGPARSTALLYEAARYSSQVLDGDDADRFQVLCVDVMRAARRRVEV